jgi:alanyl-tRNA synthetase
MGDPEKDVDVRAHTALHVLKGAVQKVIGAKVTNGVWIGQGKSRLCVEFDRRPTDEEMKAIVDAANLCIEKNLPISFEELDRVVAEGNYGDAMYDAYPVPADVKVLKVVSIADGGAIWNVNACIKPHTKTTGEVGRIEIEHWRFREPKRTLEISIKIS